jgi:hypothetical protein
MLRSEKKKDEADRYSGKVFVHEIPLHTELYSSRGSSRMTGSEKTICFDAYEYLPILMQFQIRVIRDNPRLKNQ